MSRRYIVRRLLKGRCIIFNINNLPCDFNIEEVLRLFNQTGFMPINSKYSKPTIKKLSRIKTKTEIIKYKRNRKHVNKTQRKLLSFRINK